ncbi:MAG: hypothetical protein V2J51_17015 [Erythrobacter sp.]|nr:hypothetical protein [Erythrobacter sp.]
MTALKPIFLPGVPEEKVREVYERAAGNEIASGKFASPQSSAALAANGFGWFLDRPTDCPLFPCVADIAGPVRSVAIERELRFPWSGGRHPWLDAVVWTDTHVIGVESKRYEPFRGGKAAEMSDAYDRDVWGENMEGWRAMRDLLRSEPQRYRHLDAAQLVKHALGLATESTRSSLSPVLVYLYAEPLDACRNAKEAFLAHRREIEDFHAIVAGNAVRFAACSWRGWLACFTGQATAHARVVSEAFAP